MATKPVHPTPPTGPPPSNPQSAPNLVGFDPKAAVPSQPLYIQRNDYLHFFLITNGSNVTVRIDYRWLTPQGEIKEGEFNTAPFSPFNAFDFPLYEGWLLSFSAHITAGNAPGVWVFLQALLTRQGLPLVATNFYSLIWQGYIPFSAPNGWPGTPAKDITDGAGIIRSITGATPAAGADISEVVPANRRWTLLSFTSFLTASATVANRFPGFFTDDGANLLYTVKSNAAQTAGQAIRYNAIPGSSFFADTQGDIQLPFPTLTDLKAGFRIRSSTIGIQAGDQWAAPQYSVIEWGAWDP